MRLGISDRKLRLIQSVLHGTLSCVAALLHTCRYVFLAVLITSLLLVMHSSIDPYFFLTYCSVLVTLKSYSFVITAVALIKAILPLSAYLIRILTT